VAAVAVILLLAVANNNPTTHNAAQQVINLGQGNSNTNTNSNGYVNVQKQMELQCYIALVGTNCGAATLQIYQGSSSLSLETDTASAGGLFTTGTYPSGTALTLKISGATCSTTCVTEYLPFTVPQMDPGSAISSTYNNVNVYDVVLGAWTITNAGSGGTTFTSGGTYYISQFSGNTVTVTTTLSETTTNAGYKSSYDVTNLLNLYFILQISDGAGASSSTQYATFTGAAHTSKSGNTNYYFWACPDGLSGQGYAATGGAFGLAQQGQSAGSADASCAGALSQHPAPVGTNAYAGGSTATQWTLGLGSLTTGNKETFSIATYEYADWAYFAANGNLGPNAAQVGSTFTIGIQK
jgi:hypothetical protein